jgi:hypothetical protein
MKESLEEITEIGERHIKRMKSVIIKFFSVIFKQVFLYLSIYKKMQSLIKKCDINSISVTMK